MDKIKILYIGMSPNFGGIERFLINVCKNIDSNRFEISFLIVKGNRVCFQDELEKMGIKFFEVTPRKQNYVKFLKDLKEVFMKHSFDYIHFNLVNLKCPERILMAKKYSKAKIIIHSHNALLKNFEVTHYIGKSLTRHVACIRLACGEEAGKFLFGNKKFTIMNNGMDLQKFKFNQENRNKIRNEIGVQENETVIGLIAKFEEQKNHHFLIEVFKEYPLFGIGVNAYEYFMVTVMPENNIFLPLSHAHNSFLMHLITFGIFGFITFCLFYGKIIFDLVKNIFKSSYAFCGAAVMAGYFIEALTEYNTGLSMSCMQALFLTGLMTGIMRKDKIL